MRGHGAFRRLSRDLRIGAIALLAAVALFIAAPSSWGNGIVDHGGRVMQDTTESMTSPHTTEPGTSHSLHAAAHTLVMAVLIVALAITAFRGTRRRELDTTAHATSATFQWVRRRGPPSLV